VVEHYGEPEMDEEPSVYEVDADDEKYFESDDEFETLSADEDFEEVSEDGSDPNENKVKYFSTFSRISEKRGLTHWAMYTDGKAIYSWDIVVNSKVRKMLSGLKSVSSLVVDNQRGYLFIVESMKRDSKQTSVVSRYQYSLEVPIPT